MSECVEYHLWAEFSLEAMAQKFSKEPDIVEFFDYISLHDREIDCTDYDGRRGGGMTCAEIIKGAIGKILARYKEHMVNLEIYVVYTEQAPTDIINIEEVV